MRNASNIKQLLKEKKSCYKDFLINNDEKQFINKMLDIETKLAIIDIERFFNRIGEHLNYNQSLGFKIEILESNYNCVIVLLDEEREVLEPEANVNFISLLTNQAFIQSLVPFDFLGDILKIKFSISKQSYPQLQDTIIRRLELNLQYYQKNKFDRDISVRYSDDHFVEQ